jgi:hypothetical protein
MSERERVPRAGYRLDEVYALEQHHRLLAGDELDELPEGEEDGDRNFHVVWDWQLGTEARTFGVFLGIVVEPTRAVPEEVRIGMIGSFTIEGEVQSLGLRPFLLKSAPAILFPYLRETVRSLTGRGPFGGWTVPPVNMVALAESHDFEKATGTRDLREDPDRAAGLGLSRELAKPV